LLKGVCESDGARGAHRTRTSGSVTMSAQRAGVAGDFKAYASELVRRPYGAVRRRYRRR